MNYTQKIFNDVYKELHKIEKRIIKENEYYISEDLNYFFKENIKRFNDLSELNENEKYQYIKHYIIFLKHYVDDVEDKKERNKLLDKINKYIFLTNIES